MSEKKPTGLTDIVNTKRPDKFQPQVHFTVLLFDKAFASKPLHCFILCLMQMCILSLVLVHQLVQ